MGKKIVDSIWIVHLYTKQFTSKQYNNNKYSEKISPVYVKLKLSTGNSHLHFCDIII